jgi:hypothetical protein
MNKVFDDIFSKLDYEYIGVVEIFSEIAETLGIYLYEEEDVTIGFDLE